MHQGIMNFVTRLKYSAMLTLSVQLHDQFWYIRRLEHSSVFTLARQLHSNFGERVLLIYIVIRRVAKELHVRHQFSCGGGLTTNVDDSNVMSDSMSES